MANRAVEVVSRSGAVEPLHRGVVRLSLREHVLEPDRRFRPQEMQNKWKQGTYAKGMVIPEWLIDHTDEACLRVQRRRASFAQGTTVWDEAPWSDMPELIAWLDQLRPRRSA